MVSENCITNMAGRVGGYGHVKALTHPLLTSTGHFVRIAPSEVSVSHPEGIKTILLAPFKKASWYKAMAIPDYRFQTPHSETDPKCKVARSKNFAAGYTMSNLLHNEGHIDEIIELFEGWMDKFANSGEPMDLGLFFSFATSDIM